jgi:anthranilate phosphoribosyltransferase
LQAAIIQEALKRIVGRSHLSETDAHDVMLQIMSGEATPAQIAAILTAMRMKGETIEEITGFARAMREKVIPVRTRRAPLVDTCGTGGDGTGSFNISTASAIVAAGAGVAIAKHGNRSVSSHCGSADVLETLGVRMDLSPETLGECLEEVGIAFLFAPALHPAMKHAAGPRRELGMRTVFNLLGPLTNPAGATAQVVGVYSLELVKPVARVLARLGSHRALVVHGRDGLDEISLASITDVAEVRGGEVTSTRVTPQDFGLQRSDARLLSGDTPEVNSQIIHEVLAGKPGAPLDVTLMNAAAVIVVAGYAENFREGMDRARESIASGKAKEKLEQWVAFTQAHSPGSP